MKTYTKTKKTTFFISIFLMSLLTFSQNDEKKSKDDSSDKKEKKEKVYLDLINEDAITDNGLFDVHKLSLIHI